MSKIFDLINELCPNGVEFRELQEISYTITSPIKLKANQYRKNGKIPIIDQGEEFIAGYCDCNSFINKGEYVIFGDHSEHIKFIDFAFVQGADGLKILVAQECILPKFLYYSFLNFYCRENNYKRHWSRAKETKLPVPPMEVQREIVRILDSFTLLTAELTARKKQYEFYRDFLLNFNEDQSEIEWDIIDNIFIMKNGYTPSKANKDFWENGTISWYRMEDIRENGRILSESIQKITPQAVKGGKLIPKNSIIVATTATIGERVLAIADSFLMNQRFTSFTIRELLKDKLDTKFVFYYFFKICEWCKQNTNSSSFPSVDMAKLKKIKFPIPSPQTQQKVVEILDKFDTLVNSITDGLPREIELRHKQYEHYRELLLNFKPKMTA